MRIGGGGDKGPGPPLTPSPKIDHLRALFNFFPNYFGPHFIQHIISLIFSSQTNFQIRKKIRNFCYGNVHILSCAYINYKLKILKRRYQEKWENAYLTLKNARASRVMVPRQCVLTSLTLWHYTLIANLGKMCWTPLTKSWIRTCQYTFKPIYRQCENISMTEMNLLEQCTLRFFSVTI